MISIESLYKKYCTLLVSMPDLIFCLFPIDIDFATRKIAAHLNQTKELIQNGNEFKTKTLSTFRNYILDFTVGVEFEEQTKGLDSRTVKVQASTIMIFGFNIT